MRRLQTRLSREHLIAAGISVIIIVAINTISTDLNLLQRLHPSQLEAAIKAFSRDQPRP